MKKKSVSFPFGFGLGIINLSVIKRCFSMNKVKDKGDLKPILVKFGVALALSFASFLYSRLRTRRANQQSLPSPESPRSSDSDKEIESRQTCETDSRKTRPTSYGGVALVPSKKYEKLGSDHSLVGLSPRSKLNGDTEDLLLPEFDDLVKEFDTGAGFSPEAVDIPSSDVKPPKAFISTKEDEHEEEISRLRETVRVLRERERTLEDQLLEFYGHKEQRAVVMELQNRLKLNNMEAKLFSLKIESLKAQNQTLAQQVADRATVVAELEAARAKIRLLKKKLKFEVEHNKEQIVKLQQRVAKLQDEEYKSLSSYSEVQPKLTRLGELECEVEELRKSNSVLQIENSELARTLESTQILANSVLEDSETNSLRESGERLRRENEDLRKEIEQLKEDRCSDVEELVYLRWINACLRYELRDYHPAGGKAVVARDLSKTLSPESEEKAKQLILEYANSEGIGEREINFMDLFDSDQWSESHASFTDSAELDESTPDNSSATKTSGSRSSSRKKFLSKLKKLLNGKDEHYNEKPESVEDTDSHRYNWSVSTADQNAAETNRRLRHSFDVLPSSGSAKEGRISDMEMGQRSSDVGSSCVYKTLVSGSDSTPKDENDRSELLKYAEALKSSRRGSRKLHRKSASYTSF